VGAAVPPAREQARHGRASCSDASASERHRVSGCSPFRDRLANLEPVISNWRTFPPEGRSVGAWGRGSVGPWERASVGAASVRACERGSVGPWGRGAVGPWGRGAVGAWERRGAGTPSDSGDEPRVRSWDTAPISRPRCSTESLPPRISSCTSRRAGTSAGCPRSQGEVAWALVGYLGRERRC
jgi:hypothetical protein